MLLMLGAANRNEHRYPDPHRFDISRPTVPHVGFGGGAHACLGMHLARIETHAMLAAVLDLLPGLGLDPAAPRPFVEGYELRSPAALHVLFDRGCLTSRRT